jgi:hypothetical protein
MKYYRMLALIAGGALLLSAQPGPPHMGMMDLSGKEKVEVKGTVEKVQILPGQGMPFLEVKDEKGTVKVFLGSMRYLMEKNFGPRAGIRVVVKGFKVESDVYARTVEIPAEKKSIELRAEDGTPLWRMGRYGMKK